MVGSRSASSLLQLIPGRFDIESPRKFEPEDIEVDARQFFSRVPWLRAALLGALDGLVSIAALMVGVGAVKPDDNIMIISGFAGLVSGASSMAIGEYISVYGQRDMEEAALRKEREEREKGPEVEARKLETLTQVYVNRGLSYRLAREVAEELTKVDPVRAHARDELGIDVDELSDPMQAAIVSALFFYIGAIVPIISAAFISDPDSRFTVLVGTTTLAFIVFGAFGAYVGGALVMKATVRTTVGGWMAMAITFFFMKLQDDVPKCGYMFCKHPDDGSGF